MQDALSSHARVGSWPPVRRESARACAVPASIRRVRHLRGLRQLRLRRRAVKAILTFGLVAAVASGVVAYRAGGPYGDRNDRDPRLRRVYDPVTGKLTVVAFAADGSFRLDHWCYMDGERLLRMDVDDNGDGAVDRREYYGPGERLERTEYLERGRVARAETPGGGQGTEARK